MSSFRKFLALPLKVLVLLSAVSILGLVYLSRLLRRTAEGANRHVYWVLLVAMRWVQGVPTWRLMDLRIGLFPRTKAQIAYAETQGVTRVECTCGEPDCAAKDGVWIHKITIGRPPGGDDVGSAS